MQHGQVSAEGLKHLSCTGCRRSPAEIQHDRDAVQPPPPHRTQQLVLIGRQQILPLNRATAAAWALVLDVPPQTGFHPRLTLRAQLRAIGAEHLDAVVGGRVMARRHHQATCRTHLTGQQGDRWRGTEPKVPDIPARRRQSRRQRRHQHAAAVAGIHPDQHGTVGLEHATDPVPDL